MNLATGYLNFGAKYLNFDILIFCQHLKMMCFGGGSGRLQGSSFESCGTSGGFTTTPETRHTLHPSSPTLQAGPAPALLLNEHVVSRCGCYWLVIGYYVLQHLLEDIHQPFYDTWVADFMLRQDAGRFMLGKYLSDKKIPWQRRRRLGMAVAGNTPTASFLTKIGKMQSAGCRLCRIAREARGESTDGLAAETHGHINSAGCEGMATTVTAAHHSIWWHLYDSMHSAQKQKSKLKFVTLDKESNMKRCGDDKIF